jgi:hypothetical protein
MQTEDRSRFASAIHGTFEIYSPKPVSEQLMDIWWATLKPYDIADVCRALTKHISDPERGQYQPKPADVIRFLACGEKEQLENLKTKAEMQWLNVTKAITSCGAYRTPTFKDPLTTATISALGGWPFICGKTTQQLDFLQKQFVSTYVDFEKSPLEALPNHIAGIEDIQRSKAEKASAFANLEKGLEDFRARKQA